MLIYYLKARRPDPAASDSERAIDTARHFASGLFGLDWEQSEGAGVKIAPTTKTARKMEKGRLNLFIL
jgi:hypothetical protein